MPTGDHPPTGRYQDLGSAWPAPAAHSPSAGTRCRPWRPSGARWGPRAAASRTPVAATRRKLTAERRAGSTVTHRPWSTDWVPCACGGGSSQTMSLLCICFLSRARKRAQQKGPRRCGQASPSWALVSSFGEWKL